MLFQVVLLKLLFQSKKHFIPQRGTWNIELGTHPQPFKFQTLKLFKLLALTCLRRCQVVLQLQLFLLQKSSILSTRNVEHWTRNVPQTLQISNSQTLQTLITLITLISFTSLHHPVYISFTCCHIWVASKPYIRPIYNDMGHLRLWCDSNVVQIWDEVKQM